MKSSQGCTADKDAQILFEAGDVKSISSKATCQHDNVKWELRYSG